MSSEQGARGTGRADGIELGDLFVVSAPSGAGKTTIIRELFQGGLIAPGTLAYSVSHTTRPARPGEADGRDYHFVPPATFESMVAAGQFLEWAHYSGNLYGTSRDEVLPRLARGIDVLVDIEVQGAEQVFTNHPTAQGVFILPPSYAELERRLTERGQDDAPSIRRRLDVSRWEIERYLRYGYVIINRDAAQASRSLAAIIVAVRHRRERMAGRVEQVLADFTRLEPR